MTPLGPKLKSATLVLTPGVAGDVSETVLLANPATTKQSPHVLLPQRIQHCPQKDA